MSIIRASCLCGTIRWEIDGPLDARRRDPEDEALLSLLLMSNCHCGRCRKVHGAPFATYMAASAKRFRLTAGHDNIVRYEATPGWFRPFCKTCGSTVPDGVPWKGRVGMPAGPLDDDPGIVPRSHIFVASKAPWFEITDDIPRFDAYPTGFDGPIIDTRQSSDDASLGIRGSCLCNEVRYVITKPALRCRSCHCSRCRKAGAAMYLTYLATELDGVRYTRGQELVVRYQVPGAQYFGTAFCSLCGSKMPRLETGRSIAIVTLGSLDDDPGVRSTCHIYVGSKAPWGTIPDDGTPRYDANPPG